MGKWWIFPVCDVNVYQRVCLLFFFLHEPWTIVHGAEKNASYSSVSPMANVGKYSTHGAFGIAFLLGTRVKHQDHQLLQPSLFTLQDDC